MRSWYPLSPKPGDMWHPSFAASVRQKGKSKNNHGVARKMRRPASVDAGLSIGADESDEAERVGLLAGVGGVGLGVDEDAFVLLVVGREVADEELEGLAAALVEDLVASLVEALLDVVGGVLLLDEYLVDYAAAPGVDGAADVADLEIKELRCC